MQTPTIHIILPVYNRIDTTRAYIDQLLAQSYTDYHLILADDGSTDGTADMVASRVDNLTTLRGTGDWWWAGGLHAGYKWLLSHPPKDGDLVLLMNDDVRFEPDFLSSAVQEMAGKANTLLAATAYDIHTGESTPNCAYMDPVYIIFSADSANEPNCCSTWTLFLRAEDMFKIGGFHPKLLPHFLSDIEYTLRAHQKGFQILESSSVKIGVDFESTHNKPHNCQTISQYFQSLFSKKNADSPVIFLFFAALRIPWKKKHYFLRYLLRTLRTEARFFLTGPLPADLKRGIQRLKNVLANR
ncbi:MAG: glycosyltransferase family 2 protein [Okeania sp. SIO3B3]|nr:glycosyltransferase family 2 protein [Okeania sp. SIO3B3]